MTLGWRLNKRPRASGARGISPVAPHRPLSEPPEHRLIALQVTGKWPECLKPESLLHRIYASVLYRPDAATLAQLVRRCEGHASREQVLQAARKLREQGVVRFVLKERDALRRH